MGRGRRGKVRQSSVASQPRVRPRLEVSPTDDKDSIAEVTKPVKTDDDARMEHLADAVADAHVQPEWEINGCGIPPEAFDEILRERKAESKRRAEEKRLEGLRIIREKNSRTGVDPLELFPFEIWEQIVDGLASDEHANLYEIHPLFRDLLESDRIQNVLLPRVLDLAGPFREELLKDCSTLNLRLVSKGVRNAVDKWLEDEFLTTMRTDGGSFVRVRTHKIRHPISFDMGFTLGSEAIHKILEIQAPMKIVGRELEINIRSPYNYNYNIHWRYRHSYLNYFNSFKNNVTRALEQIGDQIWGVKFFFEGVVPPDSPVQPTQLYTTLREWLVFLPNVKYMEITFPRLNVHSIDKNQVAKFNHQPFPTLRDLERVDFLYPDAVELRQAVVAANPQIKILNFEALDFLDRIMEPPIQTLQLEAFHCASSFQYYQLRLIKPIVNNSWNLKMLHMRLDGVSSPLNSIFELLNHFTLLENVTLDVGLITVVDDIDFLKLPNLQNFRLKFNPGNAFMGFNKHSRFFYSLQFLLYCNKLRFLEWTDTHPDHSDLPEKIKDFPGLLDFKGGFEDLRKSNLWDVFPFLEEVVVNIWKFRNVRFQCKKRSIYRRRELVEETLKQI